MQRCTCCSDTAWMGLHRDLQAGSEWIRFRTGRDIATVHRLIIFLSRGYSEPYLLGSQHNFDAGMLFPWAKPLATPQCRLTSSLRTSCIDGEMLFRMEKSSHLLWKMAIWKTQQCWPTYQLCPSNQLLNSKNHIGEIFHIAKKDFKE